MDFEECFGLSQAAVQLLLFHFQNLPPKEKTRTESVHARLGGGNGGGRVGVTARLMKVSCEPETKRLPFSREARLETARRWPRSTPCRLMPWRSTISTPALDVAAARKSPATTISRIAERCRRGGSGRKIFFCLLALQCTYT